MNRSDAWERFAQCRRLQPAALQVLVSADIVDALLAEACPCEPYAESIGGGEYEATCHSCGPLGIAGMNKELVRIAARQVAKRCPHYHEEAA